MPWILDSEEISVSIQDSAKAFALLERPTSVVESIIAFFISMPFRS